MTVASNKAMSGPYLGNGLTTSFDYKFKIFDKGHLTLTLHKGDGVSQTLVEGVDYTVTGVGESQGGQIMLHVAPLTGEQLTISRNVPFVQEMDLENQGAFYAEVIEQAFDEAVMRDQQLKEKLDRAITVPENVSAAAKTKLLADITRLAGSADNIDKLMPIRDAVTQVAAIADDVTSVAGFDVPAIIAAHEYAHQWAVRAQDVTVNDGVHEQGFSAYHWAQKAAASAATAEAVAGFDPDTKLDKAGGTVTGSLMVAGQLSSNVGLKAGAAEYWSNGNIYGTVWVDWDSSGFAKPAIEARIEERAGAIAEAKIAAALEMFKNNPTFTGMVKVTGSIQASGNIEAFVPEDE